MDDTSPDAAALVRRAISLATLRARFPGRSTLELVALITGESMIPSTRSGTPFMITGFVAAAHHGAARATMDVDAVIDPMPGQLADLVQQLEAAGLYVSESAAHEALADRTMFNAIDLWTDWKADLIVHKHRAFCTEEFARRLPTELLGERVAVATLGDVTLSKLEWATIGGSARQLDDVRRLLAIAGDAIDDAYLVRWIEPRGVRRAWQSVRDEPAS